MADKYRKEVLAFKKITEGNVFFCFDVETTGLSPVNNDIIQFSAIRYREKDGMYQAEDELNIYINPGYPVPDEITSITGITNEMLTGKPSPVEAVSVIYEFLGECPIVMGYNSISFDQKFMDSLYRKTIGKEFTPTLHLDVIKMAREKAEKPHKLIDMAKLAGVSEELSFHSSIDDAKATFEVFKYFLPMYETEEPKPDMKQFKITAVNRWKRSETLDRIYVNNNIKVSVYYDVAAQEWNIGGNLDDEYVIHATYEYCNVTSDKELVVKII